MWTGSLYSRSRRQEPISETRKPGQTAFSYRCLCGSCVYTVSQKPSFRPCRCQVHLRHVAALHANADAVIYTAGWREEPRALPAPAVVRAVAVPHGEPLRPVVSGHCLGND